jgi:hypothetical protein
MQAGTAVGYTGAGAAAYAPSYPILPEAGPLPGQGSEPDPLTEDAIRQAEAEVIASPDASGVESAQAMAAIGAARALAAKGQAVAARILAEGAAESVGGSYFGESEENLPELPAADVRQLPPIIAEEPEMVYQDSSNDAAASFQYATAMTPGQAAIMVPAHEQGHVIHGYSKAMAGGREVVSAYTRVFYRMDWRSGRMIAAGGQAVVQTRAKSPAPLPFPQYA